MKNSKRSLFSCSTIATALLLSLTSQADEIEKIVVTASHINRDLQAQTSVKVTNPDLASWLNSVPGANINRNGPLTGIVQYRGLFGDRVATTLNGHTLIGAGPNAMDSPLSYGPTFLVQSMTVYQGVAPVSAGINTLGGAIVVQTLKAETDNSNTWQANGQLRSAYRDNNGASTFSALTNISKQNFALLAYTDWQKANDQKTSNNITIFPTRYKKNQAGTDIRYFYNSFGSDAEIGMSFHYTDTRDAGTPALPMDIKSIIGKQVSIDGSNEIHNWQVNFQLGYLDSVHAMDNFSLRGSDNNMLFRRNDARADTVDIKVTATKNAWLFGFDGYLANHDSTVTNPNNIQFNVINFNNIQDQRLSVFAQWQAQLSQLTLDSGLRVKQIFANSGEINHHMTMMNTAIKNLKNQFNQNDRSVRDTLVDFSFNASLPLFTTTKNTEAALTFSGGIKQRAPSYQERYLWLPMESTGGLADGKTYIGNINLAAETAFQSDIGLQINQTNWQFSAHGFYQKINNYIQGISSTNMSANMVAKMMTGKMPLQYANVDATLYGSDGRASYHLNDHWQIAAMVSYVRGKRDDINDNLYRISPLNGHIKLSYQTITDKNSNLQANLMLVINDAQTKISTTNDEQKTSGYGVINMDITYELSNELVLKSGIDNLFDRNYQNHLGGYNRVKNSNVELMSRLPAQGRTIWAELNFYF